MWLYGYGTSETLLGSIYFYLPYGPSSRTRFKGTGECLSCTLRFGYDDLPQEVMENLPIMFRGISEDGPNCFSFAKKTLVDLEKVEESLGILCVSVKGSGLLMRPARTLAMSYVGKDGDLLCKAEGMVYKKAKERPLIKGTDLQKGDEVITREDSRVKVSLKDASTLDMNENTKIKVESDSEIDLYTGELFNKIKPGGDYSVRMAQPVSSVRGTQFITRVDKDGTSTLIVLEGEVEFYDKEKNKTVIVRKNQKSVCELEGLPSDPVSINPDQIPRWWEQGR